MEMRMTQGLRQRQRQRLEQRQVLKLRLLQETRDRIGDFFARYRSANLRLKDLLEEVPQYNSDHDILTYAIAGGWAVEVLTGKRRQHSNINAIMLDPDKTVLNSNMCSDYLFLQDNGSSGLKKNQVVEREWAPTKEGVYVAGPEFLIATKVAPHKGDLPREKDLVDVVYLMGTQPKLNSTKLRTALGNYPELELPERDQYVRQIMQIYDRMKGNRAKQRYALEDLSQDIANNITENRRQENGNPKAKL